MIEDLPLGGPAWVSMRERLAAVAAAGRTPVLLHTLSGPDDPRRAYVAASYLLAVAPGAYLGFRWPGGRESARDLPEYHLRLGAPLGPARRSGGVWWRDFERARVIVNPGRLPRRVPWPAGVRSGAGWLGGRGAAIAWRRASDAQTLPYWTAARP